MARYPPDVRLTGLSRNTIREYLRRIATAGLTLSQATALDEESLGANVYTDAVQKRTAGRSEDDRYRRSTDGQSFNSISLNNECLHRLLNFRTFRLDSFKNKCTRPLKRITSIAFVMIILLNTMGYYGVFLGLHLKNDIAMSKALDADTYDQSNTITLKVAVSIPYMPDQPDFDRVDGQFEHNGELYRMVKQRYAKDTLTVICVKDIEHKKIDLALSDYVKTFTDKATDTNPASKTTISFIKDYLPISFQIKSASEGWALGVIRNGSSQSLIPSFTASIIHPPERA